jgi:two-component system sensor histidine kinase KdpD
VGERLARAFDAPSASIVAQAVDGTFPLREGPRQIGTLSVDAPEPVLRRIQTRIVPALESLLAAALERDALMADAVETAALRRSDVIKTALLRSVSHDLRSPLTAILTSAEALRLAPDERVELADDITTEATRLSRLIDNLLDLSRLESGLVHPVLRDRSLEEILPLAVAGQPAGAVVLELDESAPLVHTDAGLLERVLANLVANAVRVSDGTPVRVLAHVLPDTVDVLVVDRGPGVPEDRRSRMFEPFQRLGDTSAGGLGLGLAVARGLAEALGGRLDAEDTPGGGLTMVLSIPRTEAT